MRNNKLLVLHPINFFNNIHKRNHRKRLCKIGVGSQNMRVELILFSAFGANHDDKVLPAQGIILQGAADIKPVHAGKHDIQDDDIKILLTQLFIGNSTIKNLFGIKTFLAQVVGDQVINIRIILNDNDLF